MKSAGRSVRTPGVGTVSATVVDFPAGVVSGSGTVERVETLGEAVGIVADRTLFHPVDPSGPDQPGWMTPAPQRVPVLDCLVGAIDADGVLSGGRDHPRRRPRPHVGGCPCRRCRGRTGGRSTRRPAGGRRTAGRFEPGPHGMPRLGLGAQCGRRDLWRKDVARDGIGNPDFDKIALTESRMVPDQARDTYRLGKSLRKKGFDTASFRESPTPWPRRSMPRSRPGSMPTPVWRFRPKDLIRRTCGTGAATCPRGVPESAAARMSRRCENSARSRSGMRRRMTPPSWRLPASGRPCWVRYWQEHPVGLS